MGVNGQAVRFYLTAHRERAISTLHKRSEHGSVDRFAAEQVDSNRTHHMWKWSKIVVQFCLLLTRDTPKKKLNKNFKQLSA